MQADPSVVARRAQPRVRRRRARASSSSSSMPPQGVLLARHGCLLESGDWLWPASALASMSGPSLNASLARCCDACLANQSCAGFELHPVSRACAFGTHGRQPGLLRALVIDLESSDRPRPPDRQPLGRRLRHLQHKRRWKEREGDADEDEGGLSEPEEASDERHQCTPWQPFSDASVATFCSSRQYAHRFVTSECGGSPSSADEGPSRPIPAIGVALANGLFPRGDCNSPCLYDPAQPATSGWAYDKAARCYRRTSAEHSCVAALVNDIDELTRVLQRIAAACPMSSRTCTPLAAVSVTSLSAAAAQCDAAHVHRNNSLVCTDDGPRLSLDLAHAQVSRMWADCASFCVYSVYTPAAAGWRYDSRTGCYRPFALRHPCLQERTHDLGQAALSATGKCRAPCGLRSDRSEAADAVSPFGASASLFAGLFGSRTGAAAPDGWPSAFRSQQARQAALGSWLAVVRSRLDNGAQRASACAERVAQRRSSSQAFVVLTSAREQMHKAKFVVADALYIARSLGRALVEPHVADSRLGEERPRPPSAQISILGESEQAGPGVPTANSSLEASTAEAAASAALVAQRAFSGLALRHYWDLQPLCERFDLVPFSVRHRMRGGSYVVIAPRKQHRGIGRWRLHTKHAVLKAFSPVTRARTIEIKGMWRSLSNREVVKEDATLPYYGVELRPSLFELNPGYELVALQLIDAFMQPHGATRLLAIQWRSEDWRVHSGHYGSMANATDNFRVCAEWAADRIVATMTAQRLESAFIATDLRSGSSGTYEVGGAQQEALRTLHERVPRLRNTQMHEFIDAIPDSGVRANVEATICAKARMMLATTHACTNCGRARRCSKMNSEFSKYIVRRRKAFHRPTEPLF